MIDMKYIREALQGYKENEMECDDVNELFDVAEMIKLSDEDEEPTISKSAE